uniref:Uncharacterized protein n=1 Tax=Glossina palpalis gambiensis TaxID=67801 RepID=A0A1B0BU86_9MUSC
MEMVDGRISYLVETFNAYALRETGTNCLGVLDFIPGDILNLHLEAILTLVLVTVHAVELTIMRTFELLMMMANILALGAMYTSHLDFVMRMPRCADHLMHALELLLRMASMCSLKVLLKGPLNVNLAIMRILNLDIVMLML